MRELPVGPVVEGDGGGGPDVGVHVPPGGGLVVLIDSGVRLHVQLVPAGDGEVGGLGGDDVHRAAAGALLDLEGQ